jgi:hypothetical protein
MEILQLPFMRPMIDDPEKSFRLLATSNEPWQQGFLSN